MSQSLPPPRPGSLPESPTLPRRSRYNRPRRLVSWWGLLLGLLLGVGGGLYYSWMIAPVEEFDIQPHQITDQSKRDMVVAIALSYGHDGDLTAAVERLIALQLGPDPIAEVAFIACELARSGYVDSSSGLRGVRALKQFYQLQGREGCADTLIPDTDEERPVVEIDVPTATPTPRPPPTKTATPEAPRIASTEGVLVVPTVPPSREYDGQISGTFCDVDFTGIIEVFVQNLNGIGQPGEPVRVRWDDGEDRFVTGLKPERSPGFADFYMESGTGYTIDMPGLSDPIPRPLVADGCFTEDGLEGVTSYRVVFSQIE